MSRNSTIQEWQPPKIYDIRDTSFPSFDPPAANYSAISHETPLIIDNGSWHFRAGWAADDSPRLDFPSLIARWRDRKAQQTYTLVGNDVNVDNMARSNAKSPYDLNLIANYDLLEGVYDYILHKLGVDGNGSVDHPVVLTEPVSNPSHNRKFLSELMFECYRVPSLVYGVDSLFSYYANGGRNGLVIASGNTSTHVIPVLDGQSMSSMTRRLNLGGWQARDYMLKLLQLKYPSFPLQLSINQAESLVHDHCYVPADYNEEIDMIGKPELLAEKDRIIQFSFAEALANMKTDEELAALQEKRKESGRRLQEQAAQKRLEKLIQDEEALEYYQNLEKFAETDSKKELAHRLDSEGFGDMNALERAIKDLEKTIRRRRNQDIGKEDEETVPTFPLLDVADEELDEDGKKQKRYQKLLKGNFEARLRAKAEKEKEKARMAEQARLDEETRQKDLDGWIKIKREERKLLLGRIRDRKRLKEDLNNRKSHAAQMRMKSIASLASEGPSSKKRRRAQGEDTFGANDEDWAVYRNINANASDSDEADEIQTAVKDIEIQLLEHDKGFDPMSTLDAKSDWSNSLMHAFARGVQPYDATDLPQQHQLHLNVERVRVPEILFEPSMAGCDQAGVVEIASDILVNRLDTIAREKIWQDVFLTGGYAMFDSLDERIYRDLRAVLPAGARLNVRKARNPLLDAWSGAAKWSREVQHRKYFISRTEYDEMGGDYIKEHHLGNLSSS